MRFEDWNTLPGNEEEDYKNYHHPLAKYIVAPVEGYLLHTPPNTICQMNDWCEKNLFGYWDIDYYAYFELEEDSVLFGLRWV